MRGFFDNLITPQYFRVSTPLDDIALSNIFERFFFPDFLLITTVIVIVFEPLKVKIICQSNQIKYAQ